LFVNTTYSHATALFTETIANVILALFMVMLNHSGANFLCFDGTNDKFVEVLFKLNGKFDVLFIIKWIMSSILGGGECGRTFHRCHFKHTVTWKGTVPHLQPVNLLSLQGMD